MNGIKKYRLAAGYTQQILADKIHKTRACVCQYEKGIRTPPISVALKIAEVCNCGLGELFREE